MKVLHVIPAIATRYGGPSYSVIGMCRALSDLAAGVEVTIVTTDADGADGLDVPLDTRTRYEGVPAYFFHRNRARKWKFSSGLAKWVRANVGGFDLVHIHSVFCHASYVAGAAARRHRVPYIVRPLGMLDPWSMSQRSIKKRLYLQLVERRALSCAAAIHYTTDAEARLAESALPWLPRSMVVPLGIERNRFCPLPERGQFRRRYASLDGDAPLVLFLSRIHPKKGLELLLEAIVLGQGMVSKAHLVIAGSGERAYVERLRARVKALGLTERVAFTGWLSGREKIEALVDSDLFVLPSFQENFGVAVVEAMASGTPVIVGSGVNLKEALLAAGAGVAVGQSPDELREALALLLEDTARRKQMGTAGREFALREFAWPTVASRLLQAYEKLLAAPSPVVDRRSRRPEA